MPTVRNFRPDRILSGGTGDAARNRDSRHAVEPHSAGLSSRLNWLRAAVLGANDGIVSVAGHHGAWPIFTAGPAGLVAGAVSMALGQ